MSLNDEPQSVTLSAHLDTIDIEDGKLEQLIEDAQDTLSEEHREWIARMEREGLMDENGIWLLRAIKEACK